MSFQGYAKAKLLSRRALRHLSLFALALSATAAWAKNPQETPLGIAWRVQGAWQAEGKAAPVLTGDAIQPGSLLQPGEGSGNHSITLLLPDGQRILYECFIVEDCARKFRVPSLYRRPDPFAVEMMERIQAVLVREKQDSGSGMQQSRLPRDEALAVLGPGNRIEVEGLAAKLTNGRYTYELRPLDHALPRQFHLMIEKKASSITITVPSSGPYDLTIVDNLDTPRIDLFIAAVQPAQAARFIKSFREAHALMEGWNGDFQGWPVHEFQRAYLESLMLDIKPTSTGGQAGVATQAHPVDEAAEPAFSPQPGVFDGDTAVTLRCETPGATMHYTVDGSQPINSSPVYAAPIMVKGTELTIKAFATAAGKKDSAIVTGIFRIRE